jgi:hypothetical protein
MRRRYREMDMPHWRSAAIYFLSTFLSPNGAK